MNLLAFIFNFPLVTALVGGGAVLIPVVIHLINRRRFKIVPWAAMKFLLAAQKQTRKRMRIEQLLLLLVRMAILACVVIAMSAVMPWAEEHVWGNPAARWVFDTLGIGGIGQGGKRTHRIHHLFVLDASLSTNQKADGEESSFELARQLALKKIASNPSGDAYSVLILKDSPTWLVGEASQNSRKVIDALKEAKPSHGNASVAAAYSMISAKLGEAKGRFPVQAVYFFTDMQRSTWASGAPSASDPRPEDVGKERNTYLDIESKATTIFVDCGPSKEAGNVAVTLMEFDQTYTPYVTTGMDLVLRADVTNYGAEDKKIRAEVLIGRAKENPGDPALQLRVIDQKSETIPAHESKTFLFEKVRFPAPGTYVVQVKIPDDALMEDNTRAIVITVRDTIPVLLVNGKASAFPYERATEYLRLALNPFPPGNEVKGFPLRPKVVSSFADVTEAELEQYDCIYWCDVEQFGVNDVRKLDAHLRRGGGLVISLGDKAAEKIDRYNDLLYKEGQGLLPTRFLRKIKAPAEHHFYLQNTEKDAFTRPPLLAFAAEQDQATLQNARFRQFVQAAPPDSKARTVLSFMPEFSNAEGAKRDEKLPVNAPAIVEWNPPMRRGAEADAPRGERQAIRYRGKVILYTSTVNMDWTSWPGSPSYTPMMHELTRLAVSGRLREQSQNVGSVLEAYLPGGAEVDAVVHLPGAKPGAGIKVKTQTFDEVNLFRFPTSGAHDTDLSGLYRVETSKGMELPFAINVPTSLGDHKGSESDLSRLDEARLTDLYPGWTFKVVRSALDAIITGGMEDADLVGVRLPVGPDIANMLLLCMLGLLFAEIVLAWLFGHYTTTEGAMTNAAAGPLGTTLAAAIAIFCTFLFVAGLFVVVDYWWTGDFLGFFPDLIRSWFERSIGVEPLNPGEGSNWNYEESPWLFGLPGGERSYAFFLALAAVVVIVLIYKAEAPSVSVVFKLLLGAIRLYLILLTLYFLLPRPQIRYDRLGFPDLVILIDDTRSMGEPDVFQDPAVDDRAKKLGVSIREKLVRDLPEKIAGLENQIAAKAPLAQKDADVKLEVDSLRQRLSYWEKQRDQLNGGKWRPSRLQLAQAILEQPEPHWLKSLLTRHKTKVHVFHLDPQGRATKLRDDTGDAGDLIDHNDQKAVARTTKAIAQLEPVGNDSRLGVALKQVIDHYRGSGLSSVVMFTDGVTTRDENIVEAGAYAAQKGIALFFVGIGDEQQLRDLRLHDMQVEPQIYLGDNALIEAKLTGKGYKDLVVPIVLKVIAKDGKEKELKRLTVKVDPSGASTTVKFEDTPKELGQRRYVIQVEPPKMEGTEKPITPKNLRQERTVEVIDTKQINVLFVEGQPRYEYRYIKFLMEREAPDEKKKKKSIDLNVLLLDADDDWHQTDKTAIKDFPPTLEALNKYDVLILGDCDPNHKKLQNRLKDIVAFARGEDEKGRKGSKLGGGVLFLAGALNNPHKFKGTPLADILPLDLLSDTPPREVARTDRMSPKLTPVGMRHPIFKFRPDPNESKAIFDKLQPMYWSSTNYKAKLAAEVLAVHPNEKSLGLKNDNLGDQLADRHPLVVQQFVGNQGRSLFFGFDETWRWRLKEDEGKFNNFWVQTMRYLSRTRPTQTTLTLDRQIAYLPGEPIRIDVTFPDTAPGGNQTGPKINEKDGVKVTISYRPPDASEGKDAKADPELHTLQLTKSQGSANKYEGTWNRTREGKYTFRLTEPPVDAFQPDGKKPSAEATVELPPGELDRLRMNYQEMREASSKTRGEFFTLADANELLDRLPPGLTTPISSNLPPTLLWNQWWVFALVLVLITSEWVLRKMKHLL